MFSSPSPATSPLAHHGAKSNYAPLMFQSSPLSVGLGSSPTTALQARRRREYKSQSSSRAVAPLRLEDTPQKQFLRDRFKARCLERARENRAREVRKGRGGGSFDGSSSDGYEMDDDSTMGDEDDENLDDELYRRVMMNEERRARHSKRVSFEQDFGSSIDPDMCQDMEALERELTTSRYNAPSPPAEGFEDDLIQEYLAELEEMEQEEARQQAAYVETGVIDLDREDPVDLEHEFTRGSDPQHPSPTRSMYSEIQMSSPPSSPSRPTRASAFSLTEPTSTWSCPFCSSSTARTQIACDVCMTQYPLEHAGTAWNDPESHPGGQQRNHIPLVTTAPSIGAVMLCGAPGCDWGYAL